MNRRKRVGALFLMLTMMCTMLFSTVQVSAGVEQAGLTVDGSLLTTDSVVEDTALILTRGNILNSGSAQLSNMGDRKLGIAGSTICHVYCDTVICNMYLEQLNEETGVWNSYENWNASDTNVYQLIACYEYKVEGGHWYRVGGGHSAIKNGTTESVTTTTNGIYIS